MLAPLFGGTAAEKVLLYLHVFDEGHVQKIAESMGLSPSQVRAQVQKFEDLGLLSSREIGRTRLYSWRTISPFVAPLRQLLAERLNQTDEVEYRQYFLQRTRPRRAGKP